MTQGTVSPQEKQEWATSPAGREFVQSLRAARQEAMEAWAAEAFTANTAEETLQKNAAALGGIRVIDQILEDFSELAQGGAK